MEKASTDSREPTMYTQVLSSADFFALFPAVLGDGVQTLISFST